MKWYVSAFGACVAAFTIAAVVELERADAADVRFMLLKWIGIGGATFAVLCVTLALGCGAPRCRSPK